jgi:PKD domain
LRATPKILLILVLLLPLANCGSDDSTTPAPPALTMEDSITNYDTAAGDMQTAFADLNGLLDQIEDAFYAKAMDESAITNLVNAYVTQTTVVAKKMDTLIAFEDAIVSYGGGNKGMFTNAVGDVAKGLFMVVKKTVVSSGQMVRSGWRVLSGSHTLREALKASDSGIPLLSDAAKRLEEHNAARDRSIIDAIQRNDVQEGHVPIAELQGTTTQEKIDYYRNLPDNDPLKKFTRGNVHIWDTSEKDETLKTIKKFAGDQVKNYAGAIGGSEVLVEVGDQSLSRHQTPEQKGLVRSAVKDIDTALTVAKHKTMLIQKRDQPEDDPVVAVLDGVDPDMDIPLASGIYDVVVIADDYVRSVEEGLEIAAGQVTNMLHEMYELASNSLILESVAASPETGIMGQPVTVSATVASLAGSGLTLEWAITGGTFDNPSQSGPNMTFTPTQVGPYTVGLEVSDGLANTRNASVALDVTGVQVEVLDWDVTGEQFSDGEINPGEQVNVSVTLINRGTEAVTGYPNLVGKDRITANCSVDGVTIAAGGQTTVTGSFSLPVDYSPTTGAVTHEFAFDDIVIAQDLAFDVAFGVVIDAISSPVTDRVLNISGRVSNPALATANLIIAGDLDQAYVMNLINGEFSQDIALDASSGAVTNSVLVSADSGSRREEATTSFTSQVPLAGLRVTLTWDTNGTDVDLWVTDPAGAACGYSNTYTASGLTLDFDDTNGYGPENITTATAMAGTYSVRAHYYDDNSDEANPSGCTIVVRLNEGTSSETTTTYHGTLYATDDSWTAATITIDGNGKAALKSGPTALSKVDTKLMPKK